MASGLSRVSDQGHQPIRPAATVILWRAGAEGPEVLMGQRGAGAAFMPSKYVFPGGGVDPGDHADPLPLAPICSARLALRAAGVEAAALAGAAMRELAEETGLSFDRSGQMRFVFRAITPPGRSRRFDARFLLAPADHATGDAQSFAGASGELSHLHWIGLGQARRLDLPFITEVVLAEVALLLSGGDQPGVPFFDNSGPVPTFRRLV
jgi:8-oxo-dGTP pyrophosphatase MutT (NUDIX family)